MKCFFGPTGEAHLSEKGCLFEAQGIKKKYFNIGAKSVFINQQIMQKINQGIYQLYSDIKTMEVSEFNKHIDSLIQQKYPGFYSQTISTESASKKIIQ